MLSGKWLTGVQKRAYVLIREGDANGAIIVLSFAAMLAAVLLYGIVCSAHVRIIVGLTIVVVGGLYVWWKLCHALLRRLAHTYEAKRRLAEAAGVEDFR